MPFIEIDQTTRIHYLHERGSRPETFVFCNHMGGSTKTWEEGIAPGLRSAGFGTLTLDYRAQGRTVADDGPITPDLIVNDICAVVQDAAPSVPILVGQSIGGQFAARAYLNGCPAKGLVLMNMLRAAGPRVDWIVEIESRLLDVGGERLLMDTLQPMLTGSDQLSLIRPVHLLDLRYEPATAATPRRRLADAAHLVDWDIPYEQLTLPVLAMTGMNDRLFRVQEDVDRLLSRMPTAREIRFPEGGHALFSEQPTAVIDALAEFADTVSA